MNSNIPKIHPPICPVHESPATLVDGMKIYHTAKYKRKMVWCCSEPNCDYRVGAHDGSFEPLGTMANERTRELRIQTHRAFDTLWKNNSSMKRKHAYRLLASLMELPLEEVHISSFDDARCMEAMEVIRNYRYETSI